MPRFFGKKGPRGGSRAGAKPKLRRRLNLPKVLSTAGAMLAKGTKWGTAVKVASMAGNAYRSYKKGQYQKAKRNYDSRVATGDNITNLKPCIVGKARAPAFDEKVSRVTQKPIQFCRNYQWSAEGFAGRKAHFIIELNKMNSDDLVADINTYKGEYFTNTGASDPAVGAVSISDQHRYYIDYLKEKLSFMNSSTNSLTGKMTLYAHKRDNDNQWSNNIPINPLTLMMYYSTTNRPSLVTTGSEGTIGVFAYDSTTAGGNYTAVYNMPGSSISSTSQCASSHQQLSPDSIHVREGVGFWFRKVASDTFSLKPGQQVDKTFLFNDLPAIFREQEEFVHIQNVSFCIHVEFMGQIVGDSTATTGDNVVSTGTTQLSCIRQSTRIIGVKSKIRSKVVLRTGPMISIGASTQYTINPDTGVSDTGVELDT